MAHDDSPITVQLARGMAQDLVALRRTLHEQPEVGLDLPDTQARLLAELMGLPLEITTGDALTSIVAVLRGGAAAGGTGTGATDPGALAAEPCTGAGGRRCSCAATWMPCPSARRWTSPIARRARVSCTPVVMTCT